jgi:hypothetical protein
VVVRPAAAAVQVVARWAVPQVPPGECRAAVVPKVAECRAAVVPKVAECRAAVPKPVQRAVAVSKAVDIHRPVADRPAGSPEVALAAAER